MVEKTVGHDCHVVVLLYDASPFGSHCGHLLWIEDKFAQPRLGVLEWREGEDGSALRFADIFLEFGLRSGAGHAAEGHGLKAVGSRRIGI